jgi:hypothetical protein
MLSRDYEEATTGHSTHGRGSTVGLKDGDLTTVTTDTNQKLSILDVVGPDRIPEQTIALRSRLGH